MIMVKKDGPSIGVWTVPSLLSPHVELAPSDKDRLLLY